VGAFGRWNLNRQLKSTSSALKRAEVELRNERVHLAGTMEIATEADGDYLTDGNARTRDEAYRSDRQVELSRKRVDELRDLVRNLQAKQDELLDRLGQQIGPQ
jgi:uncharacterized coiled-coil DUF342 family protein